jgi:hypothetical protein
MKSECKMQSAKCKMKNAVLGAAFCTLHFAFCILHCVPCSFLALGSLLALPSDSQAQSSTPPEVASIRVGLADRYKVGLWTQVEVTLRGGSEALAGELSLIVPDSDGVPSRVSQPCRLAPGRETTVRLLCRLGRLECALKAELRVGDVVVARKTFQTAAQADAEHFLPGLEFQELIVTVGPSELGIEETGKLTGTESEFRPVAAHVDNVDRLPTHWSGYEGVDAVVLSTSRPELYSRLASHPAQTQALDDWVRMGGRLVLCAGSQAEKTIAVGMPLGRFAPGRLERMVPLRQTGALESYCGSRSGVPQTGGAKTVLRVPRLADVQGTVEAREADLPLVVRTARGFGQVIFLAADLDQPPLRDWTDRALLVAKLLDMPTGGGEESEASAAMMHFGYSDLSGQLRSALDRFPGVNLAPFWLVAGLIVVYLLLIGPGDYFFLRKLTRRMEWTWLTFPLMVLLVCVGAYLLAYWLKGDSLRLSQIDLVDVDAASGQLRGTAWMNVFSPRMESFNLSVEPRLPESSSASVLMAWLGLPGAALGGMNPRAGGPSMWTEPYSFSSSLDAMREVPIQVWSTKSFTARWHAPTKAFPESDLTDESQILVGSITNTLDFPLEQCIVAHGRSVYDLGTISPGESARLGTMTKRSELKTLLTGRKVVFIETGDKYSQQSTPYDQSSVDVPYILRTMMFYEAAGGRRYTGLWNAYQSFVDLSTLLSADRAILVAQVPADSQEKARGATLLRNGKSLESPQNKHITIYRFVFPVKKEKGG